MKQAIRCITLATCLSVCYSICFAQNEGTMYFMNSLPQVTYVNPALIPAYRFSIGTPGSSVFVQYANNGFSYNSFATKVNDSTTVDLDKLYSKLKKKNYITTAVQADLFRFSLKVNPRLYLTFNSTAKSYNRIMLPKDLTGLFINGTTPYVNGKASLSPEVEAMAYLETALGLAYKVNQKFTMGVRVKWLKGLANATTQHATVNLALDGDYAMTATADVDTRTSGVHNLTTDGYKLSDHWHDYLKNNGFAFDLGAAWQMNDRLTISGSLIDIGSITWKNDPYEYKLDPAKANYTFKGIDLRSVLNGNSDYINHEGDSISKNFKLQEGERGSYRTPLPGKLYLGGNYKLKRNLYCGGLFFAEKFRGRFSVGGSVSIHKEFGRRLSTSLSYTISNSSYNNIGAGLSLNMAPFQLYIVGDNLLRGPLAILTKGEVNSYANNMQYFNLRVGLNFVFGWDKTQEKLPSPKTKTSR
jgi:hypothetical protein